MIYDNLVKSQLNQIKLFNSTELKIKGLERIENWVILNNNENVGIYRVSQKD